MYLGLFRGRIEFEPFDFFYVDAITSNNEVITFYCLRLLMPLVGVSTAVTQLAMATPVIKMSKCLGIRS
jgi:hypothetical protein